MAEPSSSPDVEEKRLERSGSRSSQDSSSSRSSSFTSSSTVSRHHYPQGEGPDRSAPRLSRSESRGQAPILQRVETTLSTIRSRKPVPPFRHPLAQVPTTKDVIVDFNGPDDPYRPLNWTFKKKVVTTLLYGLTTMGTTWASSVISPGINLISEDFEVKTIVATCSISLMLFGFGLGPLVWAPLSEGESFFIPGLVIESLANRRRSLRKETGSSHALLFSWNLLFCDCGFQRHSDCAYHKILRWIFRKCASY
jgi:hypothetical protein